MSDIAAELAKLHTLKGADYSRQVERIARLGNFHPVEGETGIFSTGSESEDDYNNLLNAARKAVTHGYKVYILPNPSKTQSPDFIFERKGTYRPYELKTITGRDSVSNRLEDSIGQCNRVLIHLMVNYKASLLAFSIKHYFEQNKNAIEVLIFKGRKSISVSRELTQSKSFYGLFMKNYFKKQELPLATLFNLGSVGEGLPHAENTGLVISDTAKVQQISFLAILFDTFFHFFRKNTHPEPLKANCL